MDRLIMLLGGMALLAIVGFFGIRAFAPELSQHILRVIQSDTVTITPTTIPPKSSPAPTPVTIRPKTLIINKLNIRSVVEEVGVTESGAMDVPVNAANVGWYRHGTVPTSRGNAVISGHYDTPSGRPAVFYTLGKLAVGDDVIVEMSDGKEYRFVVTAIDNQPVEVFPTAYVFQDKYGINLNLITCSGIWDPTVKNYSKRLVIYTTLQGTQFNTL